MIIQFVLIIPGADASITISEFNNGKGRFEFDGNVTTRYSYWNWFDSNLTAADNDYDYFFERTRIGLTFSIPQLKIYVQGQDVHMWGLPDDALAPAPQGPLGIGGIYYLHMGDTHPHSTIIRQAYVDFSPDFAQGLTTRLGRFDYVDALEVTYKNPKVMWLKNIRLAERLIGPFGWSSFCRSFDGLQLAYDQEDFNIHTTLTHPTQGGFENNAHKTINGIDLFTLTGTAKYDQWIPNSEGRIFYFYYNDDRNITASVDNTGNSVLDMGDIKINTFGMHFLSAVPVKQGILDGLIWAAYQTGDWADLDHKAWAWDVECGFQFTKIPLKPWIRAGYFMSSGDSNAADGDHETFYQLLPTTRKYALFPFYNMMNNEDLFIQAILKPMKAWVIRADLHYLKLTEKNDRWYMGAGPTQKNGTIFGYIARPSFGDDNLATVCELTTMYTFSKHISGTLYWGHAFGNDVIENIYNEEDGDFFFMEMSVKF
jgi:hypothetical protein